MKPEISPTIGLKSPGVINFSTSEPSVHWSYSIVGGNPAYSGQYFKMNGASAQTGWLEVPFCHRDFAVQFWFTTSSGQISETEMVTVAKWCGEDPNSNEFHLGECQDGVLYYNLFCSDGKSMVLPAQIKAAKLGGSITRTSYESYNGKEVPFAYYTNLTRAAFDAKYPADGVIEPPIDPPVDPPDDSMYLQAHLLLKCVAGFDTGIQLVAEMPTNIKLVFYKQDEDSAKPGIKIAEKELQLGPNNSVSKMVLANWNIAGGPDIAIVYADHYVACASVWVGPKDSQGNHPLINVPAL